LNIPGGCSPQLAAILREFKRQALHAARLGFIHPITGDEVSWEVPLPEDMLNLLAILKADMS
jgi:23S rRNA pseudouridine1911/1915/1917 synthase